MWKQEVLKDRRFAKLLMQNSEILQLRLLKVRMEVPQS